MQSGPIVDPRSIREDTADSSTRTSLTFTGIARRHYRLILAFVAGAMLLGTLGALLLKPTYMATATLMIDPRKIELLRKQSVVGGMRFDDSTYPTHVTVLKTKSIALSVIKALDLTKDPEFVGPPRSFWETAFGLVFGEDEQRAGPTEANLTERALAVFEKRRMITRVQTSHLITVSFTASDPDKAARIATAIAEAYIAEELDAKHRPPTAPAHG